MIFTPENTFNYVVCKTEAVLFQSPYLYPLSMLRLGDVHLIFRDLCYPGCCTDDNIDDFMWQYNLYRTGTCSPTTTMWSYFDKISVTRCTGSCQLPVQRVTKISSKWHLHFSNYILWDVITCPCLVSLMLVAISYYIMLYCTGVC